MINRGIAVVGIGEHKGQNAAFEAINDALMFVTIDGEAIHNSSGVLVHFNMHPEYQLIKLSTAMELIHDSVDESADVIFGTTTDESLPLDFIGVTVIGTGVERIRMLAVNNVF